MTRDELAKVVEMAQQLEKMAKNFLELANLAKNTEPEYLTQDMLMNECGAIFDGTYWTRVPKSVIELDKARSLLQHEGYIITRKKRVLN